MLDRGRKEEQGSYLSRAHFVPGPLLYILSYLNHTEPGQMDKLRLRELQKLGHGPTASKEQSRDSVPSLFPPDILTWDTEISPPHFSVLFCYLIWDYILFSCQEMKQNHCWQEWIQKTQPTLENTSGAAISLVLWGYGDTGNYPEGRRQK